MQKTRLMLRTKFLLYLEGFYAEYNYHFSKLHGNLVLLLPCRCSCQDQQRIYLPDGPKRIQMISICNQQASSEGELLLRVLSSCPLLLQLHQRVNLVLARVVIPHATSELK